MSDCFDHNVLIFAPVGADAVNSSRVLDQAGITSEICESVPDLCLRIERGGGLALISEEVLFSNSTSLLLSTLRKQPKWSDMPVILVLKAGARKDAHTSALMEFIRSSNTTVLERPLRLLILVSTIQAALRSRQRQYDVRDLLEQREAIITERILAEQALSDQHRLTKTIADNARSCLVLMDSTGHATYVNPAFEKVTGYKLEEIKNKRFHDTIQECENVYIRKDGTRFPVRSFTAPLEQNGTTAGAVIEFCDITREKLDQQELKNTQEKLSRHAEDLERRVAERTASLKESVESLEGVCYTIAHDLRAPLRALEGFTEILFTGNEKRFDEEERGYATRIISAATGMDMLINDLLEYARLSHQELPCQSINLDSKLASIITQLSTEIAAKNASIQVNPLPLIWANETVVEQVFVNLLTNAMKFVVPGMPPRVEIFATIIEPSARICVKDNGIGIPPEHHERVFGAFQRLHKVTEYPGTGIGLAIVKKGVERMGGRIHLISEPGKGCCFEIELMLAQ